MLYDGLVAMAGVALLLGGWLWVQRLTATAGAPPADPVHDAPAAAEEQGTACGACTACSPAARLPKMVNRDELARDGPAAAPDACESRPFVAL